ncbi:MAG: transposase [Candidatus Methylacidiphilales bacterium]|nr:transposase [Candidatus Methylacidiphilales bacterium]
MTPKNRKHPAHGVWDLPCDAGLIVFLTVCTKDRLPWLADPSVHALLRETWLAADDWKVMRYVLMPDHLHLLCYPSSDGPLERWVRYWKSSFTQKHKNPDHRWQTDHWDRRLRGSESLTEKWAYILENPVRYGLVAKSSDWSYQGTLTDP